MIDKSFLLVNDIQFSIINRTRLFGNLCVSKKNFFRTLRGMGGNATIMGVGQVGGKRAKVGYGGLGFGFGIRLGMLGK